MNCQTDAISFCQTEMCLLSVRKLDWDEIEWMVLTGLLCNIISDLNFETWQHAYSAKSFVLGCLPDKNNFMHVISYKIDAFKNEGQI